MILSLLLLLSIAPTASANTPVWELVQNARRDTPVLHELSPADQHRARLLFRGLLQAAEGSEIPARLREQATGLGLHIRIEEDRVLVWGRENSVGLYVIRLGPALPAILQAPHSFYDLGSGKLTSALFEAGTWRAAYFNSGHRYGRPGLAVEERPDPNPDVAHPKVGVGLLAWSAGGRYLVSRNDNMPRALWVWRRYAARFSQLFSHLHFLSPPLCPSHARSRHGHFHRSHFLCWKYFKGFILMYCGDPV